MNHDSTYSLTHADFHVVVSNLDQLTRRGFRRHPRFRFYRRRFLQLTTTTAAARATTTAASQTATRLLRLFFGPSAFLSRLRHLRFSISSSSFSTSFKTSFTTSFTTSFSSIQRRFCPIQVHGREPEKLARRRSPPCLGHRSSLPPSTQQLHRILDSEFARENVWQIIKNVTR